MAELEVVELEATEQVPRPVWIPFSRGDDTYWLRADTIIFLTADRGKVNGVPQNRTIVGCAGEEQAHVVDGTVTFHLDRIAKLTGVEVAT